jgi:hypothetical protein
MAKQKAKMEISVLEIADDTPRGSEVILHGRTFPTMNAEMFINTPKRK